MTRYFFTDPLAAAWMAKHFGMRFIEHGDYSGNILYTEGRNGDTAIADHTRYTIHSDSLSLLEPLAGDCLRFPKAIEPYWTCKENGADLTKLHMSFARYKIAQGDCQIVQRNGISFHWPESEAA